MTSRDNRVKALAHLIYLLKKNLYCLFSFSFSVWKWYGGPAQPPHRQGRCRACSRRWSCRRSPPQRCPTSPPPPPPLAGSGLGWSSSCWPSPFGETFGWSPSPSVCNYFWAVLPIFGKHIVCTEMAIKQYRLAVTLKKTLNIWSIRPLDISIVPPCQLSEIPKHSWQHLQKEKLFKRFLKNISDYCVKTSFLLFPTPEYFPSSGGLCDRILLDIWSCGGFWGALWLHILSSTSLTPAETKNLS